jgi:hypothetical protein
MKTFQNFSESLKKDIPLRCFASIHQDNGSIDESFVYKVSTPVNKIKPGQKPPGSAKQMSHDEKYENLNKEERASAMEAIGHHEKLNTQHGKHSGYTNLDGLSDYTGTHAQTVNKLLYNSEPIADNHILNAGDYPDKESEINTKEFIARVDTELSRPENAIKKPISVYSGVKTPTIKNLNKAQPGQKIHFPAYTSTSLDNLTARSFSETSTYHDAGVKNPHGHNYHHISHVVVFHLPEGYHHGRHVQSLSFNPTEDEFLLARNQKWNYKEKTLDPIKGVLYHHMEPSE